MRRALRRHITSCFSSRVRRRRCRRKNQPLTQRTSPFIPSAATGFSRRNAPRMASRTIGRLSLPCLRSTSTAPASTESVRQRCWWSGIQPLNRARAGAKAADASASCPMALMRCLRADTQVCASSRSETAPSWIPRLNSSAEHVCHRRGKSEHLDFSTLTACCAACAACRCCAVLMWAPALVAKPRAVRGASSECLRRAM